MDARAREALIKIVGTYGIAVIANPQQLRGLLRDISPDCNREIRWLVTAVEEGVPHALKNGDGVTLAAEVRVQQQCRRFADATGFGDPVALWTVESWALALGVIQHGQRKSAESANTVTRNGQASATSDSADVVTPEFWARELVAPTVLSGLPNARIREVTAEPLAPDGCRPAPYTVPEPYTGTGWAKEVIHDQTGIELVYVPAGTFMMGSPESERGRSKNERLHQVTLRNGFYLGKYPVTQRQWKRVMGNYPSEFKEAGGDAPVEQVSWDDCQEFCGKLGAGFRLPTEAEWEYACRAGTTGPFAGDLDDMGWYERNSGGKTHPVGQKQPNAWGIYDMHGNVLEWCSDWYGEYPNRRVTDPAGPGSGSVRVFRGGSWNSIARYCRSAIRCRNDPGSRFDFLGLRLLRTVPGSSGKRFADDGTFLAACGKSSEKADSVPQETVKLAGATNALAGMTVRQLRLPDGFTSAPVITPEPYTNTGWAKEIVHEQTGIEMVYIPAGTFMMGSPTSEAGRKKNETRHRVTLTKGFYLGKYEVTQGQWERVMGNNPAYFKNVGRDAPVEEVSWEDCQEFCRKLGDGFRLPTEAEWEYACRAGTTGAYGGDLDEMGWYDKNSGKTMHPVGQKKPNAWGLYDMHGNIFEWCQDWYGEYLHGSVTDPAGPGSGAYRVDRGGNWFCNAWGCRSAYRGRYDPGVRYDVLGLRLVRTVLP